MKAHGYWWLLGFVFCLAWASGQPIPSALTKLVISSQTYLVYLHAGVITNLGDNAINPGAPEWGPYEYSTILDSLRGRGFNVISEIRQKGVSDSVYIHKVSRQIDSLVKTGVPARHIVVIGASSGWTIALGVSAQQRKNELNFVMMGGCWPNTDKEYTQIKLYGRILSIIEASDPHGTCAKLFEGRNHHAQYEEVVLHTGLSHGFFYKARKEWIDPVISWLNQR